MQCDVVALKQVKIETENAMMLARVDKYEKQVAEIARALKENTDAIKGYREETNDKLQKSMESTQN